MAQQSNGSTCARCTIWIWVTPCSARGSDDLCTVFAKLRQPISPLPRTIEKQGHCSSALLGPHLVGQVPIGLGAAPLVSPFRLGEVELVL